LAAWQAFAREGTLRVDSLGWDYPRAASSPDGTHLAKLFLAREGMDGYISKEGRREDN